MTSSPASGAFFASPQNGRVELSDGVVIGRVGGDGITFDVPSMSRRHAQVSVRSGSWWLSDLQSKNGTFVNGRIVGQEPVLLADGDEVVFAGVVAVTFHDPAATPIAPRIGRLAGVWIDPESDAVWVDATRIEPPLSAHQLELLKLLDARAGEVVSRRQIVATVWANVAASGVSDEAVTALIKRLRARLRESPLAVEHLQVVKGRGVRLNRPD